MKNLPLPRKSKSKSKSKNKNRPRSPQAFFFWVRFVFSAFGGRRSPFHFFFRVAALGISCDARHAGGPSSCGRRLQSDVFLSTGQYWYECFCRFVGIRGGVFDPETKWRYGCRAPSIFLFSHLFGGFRVMAARVTGCSRPRFLTGRRLCLCRFGARGDVGGESG